MSVESIIEDIIQREGGYSENPNDLGGPTKFGVTEAVARANGYQGQMADFPIEMARLIYRNQYYIKPGFGRIALLSQAVAEELTDTGVNTGVDVASRFLQRCLNVLNREQKLYRDISVDGSIGQATLEALEAYLKARGKEGETVLLTALNCLQGARYIEMTERREKNEEFLFGWLRSRVTL